MHVTDNLDADPEEKAYPFPDTDFVGVKGPVLAVVPGSDNPTAHLFRPADNPGEVRYTGRISDRGTWTDFDTFRPGWNKSVAGAVESAGYTVVNTD